MNQDQLEQEALGWLADVGYQHRYGPDLAPDGSNPERSDYRQMLLVDRLRQAVAALNPSVPAAAREDAVKQVLDLGTPVLLAANRHFHRLLVGGVLAPTFLLDYLRFFVLFEDDGGLVKKIAGYHQFHAVRAAITQVVAASRPDSDARLRGKGGVVWHTQGSGNSITMTCFAARVMQEPAMENPTVVVITDRNDLDGQLIGVFSLAQDLLREQPVQAATRQELRALLGNRPSGGIVFATIQKFMPGEDEDLFPLLSDRHNIVVMADEAHRTQYGFEAKLKTPKSAPKASSALTTGDGQSPAHRAELAPTAKYQVAHYQAGYAQHLRDALPNATFVAFTGTPVSGEDRDTRAVFGDYISVYDMQQAKADGATVAIYHESRLAKLGLKADEMATIDDEVDELAEDEEESQQAKLKSRWAALEKVVGAAPRVAQVAADLVAHFEERNKAQTGKAMVVAMSREICVHLYDEIIKLRPDWHSPDPEQGAIKIMMTGSASDKALLRPHIYSAQVKKRLEKRFKSPADPLRLVIVRDMWLTGFDAPCVHTLYVDKPISSTTPSWPRCATCPSAIWRWNCWSGCSKARSSHVSRATWCRARGSRTCWPGWCSATRTDPSKLHR